MYDGALLVVLTVLICSYWVPACDYCEQFLNVLLIFPIECQNYLLLLSVLRMLNCTDVGTKDHNNVYHQEEVWGSPKFRSQHYFIYPLRTQQVSRCSPVCILLPPSRMAKLPQSQLFTNVPVRMLQSIRAVADGGFDLMCKIPLVLFILACIWCFKQCSECYCVCMYVPRTSTMCESLLSLLFSASRWRCALGGWGGTKGVCAERQWTDLEWD